MQEADRGGLVKINGFCNQGGARYASLLLERECDGNYMLKTPFGNIVICVRNEIVEYNPVQLEPVYIGQLGFPVFEVEGRFRIKMSNLDKPISVSCTFIAEEEYSSGINSGERLALKSWDKGQQILSIGTEDEIPGIEVRYLDNGLEVISSENSNVTDIVFQIAWMTIQYPEKEDSYTWYAADPTY